MKIKQKKLKTENVADVIAKSCGIDKPELDPALCKIFASAPKVQPRPIVIPSFTKSSPTSKVTATKGKASLESRSRNGPETDDVKLSNRDAAAIRVEARLKSKMAQNLGNTSGDVETDKSTTPVKRPKKQKSNARAVKIESDAVSEDEIVPKKRKREDADDSGSEAEATPKSRSGNKTHQELDAPKEKDEELELRTVFIGNVPKDIKKSRLKKIFTEYGEIETIRFRGAAPAKPTLLKKVAFRKNELHPDAGSIVSYIRFKTRKEAKRTVRKLNGYQLGEHYLTVDLAVNKKKRDTKKAVFVGNLNIKIHDNNLRAFFADCGPISNVRVIRDRATGIGKGFGYINFQNLESIELALKLDGNELMNRPIRVKRAVKKEKVKNSQGVKKSQGMKKRMKAEGNPNNGKTPNTSKVSSSTTTNPKVKTERKVKKESFVGDCLSEIGKLKRKAKKPNKGELRKARIIHKLTGVKPKDVGFQKQKKKDAVRYFRK